MFDHPDDHWFSDSRRTAIALERIARSLDRLINSDAARRIQAQTAKLGKSSNKLERAVKSATPK